MTVVTSRGVIVLGNERVVACVVCLVTKELTNHHTQ